MLGCVLHKRMTLMSGNKIYIDKDEDNKNSQCYVDNMALYVRVRVNV